LQQTTLDSGLTVGRSLTRVGKINVKGTLTEGGWFLVKTSAKINTISWCALSMTRENLFSSAGKLHNHLGSDWINGLALRVTAGKQ
jgi:hypothetical protein